MLVNRRVNLRGRHRYAGFGESEAEYCDRRYPDQPNNSICKSRPYGPLTPAPWTDAGALVRGLPKPWSPIVNAVTIGPGGSAAPPSGVNSDNSVISKASMTPGFLALAAFAVVGIGAAIFMKKKG
jgi:hypothetical protein